MMRATVTQPTILLIDDDPTQIAILRAYLASMKLDGIVDAADASQALKWFEPDSGADIKLVFTDLGMPEMDGFEFLRHLAKIEYAGEVVVISGHENILLESAASLGKMYGLSILGQIRKPLTKPALDRLFKDMNRPSSGAPQATDSTLTKEALVKAIANKRILPYYQPKVDLLNGQIVGAEALARWTRDDGGFISPGDFIPLAESTGLISEVSLIILDQVLSDIADNREYWGDKKVAINLPPELVRDTKLPDLLEERLKHFGVSSSNICIEITESGVLDFDPVSVEVLSRLRIKGFDISIDDFGTGAANISNLKVFPYSEMKIDQSFINNVLTDAFSAETVRTSISLARQLGLRIIAEGIENEEVLQYVKAKGIDQAQGFLFSRPVPAEAMNEMFKSPLSWIRDRHVA